jgi:hypothetical protein
MLAGNVTATLSGGVLTLTGDALDNDITLTGAAPNITVTGNGGTIVCGLPSKSFSGVTGNVNIFLKAGNDTVTVDSNLNKSLLIDTGAGDTAANGADSVSICYVSIQGDVTVLTGASQDRVLLDDVYIGKSLLIDTGSENDEVQLPNNQIKGDATVLTGSGKDEVTSDEFAHYYGVFKIDTGSESDEVDVFNNTIDKDFLVYTGSGADSVSLGQELSNVVAATTTQLDGVSASLQVKGSLLVDTGSDSDTLTVVSTTVLKDATLLTGQGADNVQVGVQQMTAWLQGNASEIGVSANVEVYGYLKIDTGSEADSLTVANLIVGKDATILTGSGADHVNLGVSILCALSVSYEVNPAASTWASITVYGNFSVDTGSEGDWLNVVSLYVGKNAQFVTGGGNDFVNIGLVTKTLEEWPGWTYSSANIYVGGNLLIDTGGENDCLELYSVYAGGNANIFLGGGADKGDLAYVSVKKAFKLDAGGENDNVKGYDISAADSMAFLLGGGDDMLCLGDCWSKTLLVDGGGGYDQFLEDPSNPNSFGKRTVVGIEKTGTCYFFAAPV